MGYIGITGYKMEKLLFRVEGSRVLCLGCRIQGFRVEGFKLEILSLVLGAWARRLVGTVVSCGKQTKDSLGMEGIYKRCIWGM